MEKKTTLNQIEITDIGFLQIRIALEIVDGAIVHSRKWHRSSCPPGWDIDGWIAMVNRSLQEDLNYPGIGAEDVARIKGHAAIAWTPEVIAAHRAALEAAAQAG